MVKGQACGHLDVSEQMIELHQGQGMEIRFRDNYICPSEDEYKQIVMKSKQKPVVGHFG